MRKTHANHGRDHLSTGADPIPGLSTSGISFLPYMPNGFERHAVGIFGSHTSNNAGDVTQDSSVIGGGYTSNTSSSNSPFIYMPVFIGKADGTYGPSAGAVTGIYRMHHVVRVGPDCGKLVLEVSSAYVSGSLLGVFSGSLTWVSILSSDDLYAASSSWGAPYSSDSANMRRWYVYLTGALGDAATTYAGRTSGALNGGPGLYYFRYSKDGKNGSSSGYKIDMAQFGVSAIAG